jgi:hypothetical protein
MHVHGRKFRSLGRWVTAVAVLLVLPRGLKAQGWKWTQETVDDFAMSTSIAADHQGNLHVAYAGDGGSALKYAFRAVETGRWYSLVIDKQLPQGFSTGLSVDAKGNPHICYTPQELRYAYWDGRQWHQQTIAKGEGPVAYDCTIVMDAAGVPHMAWAQAETTDGTGLYHIRHALLKDGVWMAKTIDFDGEGGKWNSMVLDAQGTPDLVYSAFPPGMLRHMRGDGARWKTQPGISPIDRTSTLGMGNSLALTPEKGLALSFYEAPVQGLLGRRMSVLKFARQNGTSWSEETVDFVTPPMAWVGFRSSLVLDHEGFPHISYEDGGTLKHAYWDGKRWQIQVVAKRGIEPYLYSSMAIGPDDTLYISYRDPTNGSLKVAVGHPEGEESISTSAKDQSR